MGNVDPHSKMDDNLNLCAGTSLPARTSAPPMDDIDITRATVQCVDIPTAQSLTEDIRDFLTRYESETPRHTIALGHVAGLGDMWRNSALLRGEIAYLCF